MSRYGLKFIVYIGRKSIGVGSGVKWVQERGE